MASLEAANLRDSETVGHPFCFTSCWFLLPEVNFLVYHIFSSDCLLYFALQFHLKATFALW